MADDMRTLGYICPQCGAPVMGARSIFALEASDAEIECSCGGSVLHTRYDGQNYRLLVPCGVCGKTHEAVCPPERMLRGATALSCPDSRQFCCFIGEEGTVEHHLREAGIAISKEKAQESNGEAEAFTDNVIMYEFLSELKDIAARPATAWRSAGTRWSWCAGTVAPGCGSAPQLTGIWTISAAT